jgi:hypothetical protein
VRFVVTSGTGARERVEERPDARSTLQCVVNLISLKRPGIRVFDADGRRVSFERLPELAVSERDNERSRI